jgi:scyllo-inositol 2-dehydrogenase (NADP+)
VGQGVRKGMGAESLIMPKRIAAGLASFGMSGKVFHAPLLSHHERFALRRIVERRGDEAKSLYPDAIVSRSTEDLIADPGIDLIVVNVPDKVHYELAKRCLEADKHVVIEKPMTQTVEQARELIELAARRKKMLTVFQNRRWDGDFMTVKKVVHSKALGRLVEFESHYDRYRNFIQKDTWKERSAESGGILTNLGSHMIDQALVLFGMPGSVTAEFRIVRTGGEVDDWYNICLQYDELTVILRASYLVKEPGPRYILHGTEGTFHKYGLDPQEEALKKGIDPGTPGWGSESMEWFGTMVTEKGGITKSVRLQTLPGNYSAFYDAVADCIENRGEPPVRPIEAANVIRVIEAAQESHRRRATINLQDFKP